MKLASIRRLPQSRAGCRGAWQPTKTPSEAQAIAILRKNVLVLWAPQRRGATERGKGTPSRITSIEQLRGKVLGGYTAQATVNTILIELLRKRGLKPDEYKILNVGTARLPALLSGNVPAAVLNGLETAKAVKQGFRPLARAADEIELATGGLGASVASIQSKREIFRAVVQAVLESIRISATQKERVLLVLMKQFSIPYDDASLILDIVQKGWALDGRPTPGSQKFEFDLAQREMGLKEPPKPEQVYDFSILEELTKK